jgi:invasion protein IalB
MYVNRSPVERPGMPHRAIDISARGVKPGVNYNTPVVLQQANTTTPLSARRPPKPQYLGEDSSEEEDEEEESEESDSDEDETGLQALLQFREQHREQQAFLQRKKEADRQQMPPPPPPNVGNAQQRAAAAAAAAAAAGFSMRRPPSAAPKVTYGANTAAAAAQQHQAQLNTKLQALMQQQQNAEANKRPAMMHTGGAKSTSYHGTGAVGAGALPNGMMTGARRNSFYGGESNEDLERHHQLMLAAANRIGQQDEARRRAMEMQRKRNSFDLDSISDDLMTDRLQNLGLDASHVPPPFDPKVSSAQQYMEQMRQNAQPSRRAVHQQHQQQQQPPHPLTTGAVRRNGRDETRSSRSRHSSREGSSTTRNHRRMSVAAPEARLDEDGFKMKIDPDQDYDVEFGNQRLAIRPTGEGSVELFIGGRREGTYYATTRDSASTSSKIDRRTSTRTARTSRTARDDYSEEERDERRSTRNGAARRRAETYGGSVHGVDDDRRRERRRSPAPAPAPAPALRRRHDDDERDQRGSNRRRYEEDSEEERERERPREREYRGPPRYGVAPDEYGRQPTYPRYGQGYSHPSAGSYGSAATGNLPFGA